MENSAKLVPDSRLVTALHPSPNVEPRLKGLSPTILLLHYTGLPTVERAIEVLSSPICKVSCHYVIDLQGRIAQMVAEKMRAWHAGVSFWAGETDINSASIGIEIQNEGHACGLPDYPAAQMRVLARLCREIIRRHDIRPERVLAHSDVAPARKIDPGEGFDWGWMWRNGVGHWVEPVPVDERDEGMGPGAADPRVARVQLLLARYGYGVPATGEIDPGTEFVVRAFQRHFRPARVDGRIDKSTIATLERLIAALPGPLVA